MLQNLKINTCDFDCQFVIDHRKVMFRKEAMLWLLGDVTGKFTFYGANEVDNTGKENRTAFFIRGI